MAIRGRSMGGDKSTGRRAPHTPRARHGGPPPAPAGEISASCWPARGPPRARAPPPARGGGRAADREADFVRRLFVGELRQGALDGLMADAVALAAGVPAASVRRAAMLSGDLRRSAAVALADGIEGLDAIGLTVLRPVLPMLASTSATVAEAIAATGPASVSWKLDGARIQVHRAGDLVRVFTRNLNDVTARLPVVSAIVGELPVRSVVLDGEAIGLGPDGRPHPFQDTMSRFGTEVLPGAGAVPAVPLSG